MADEHGCFFWPFWCEFWHDWNFKLKLIDATFFTGITAESKFWIGCFMRYSSTSYDLELRILLNVRCGRPAQVLFWLFWCEFWHDWILKLEPQDAKLFTTVRAESDFQIGCFILGFCLTWGVIGKHVCLFGHLDVSFNIIKLLSQNITMPHFSLELEQKQVPE